MTDQRDKQLAKERLQAALLRVRNAQCTCESPALRALRQLGGGPPRHDSRNAECELEKAAQEVDDTIEETGFDVVDLGIQT